MANGTERPLDDVDLLGGFEDLRWPKWRPPEPDPFAPDERDWILAWFETKGFRVNGGPANERPRVCLHPAYFVYLHLLFWSGMRPSEGAGLQWQDVDLERALIHVRRSRHLWEYGDTKTEGARRSVQLFPLTVDRLRTLQPLRVTPEMPVFVNTLGLPLEPNSLLPHWYACQRALGIRVRGLYCTKDTFVTTALYRMRETNQIDIPWLERQTGVQYQTLKKHYGRWWPDDGGRELRKLAAEYPELFQGRIVPPQRVSGGTIGASTRKIGRREVRKGGFMK